MTENQENKPEVGFRVRLWFAFALADLAAGEVVPDSWRDHIPSVDINLLRPVGVPHLSNIFLSPNILFPGALSVTTDDGPRRGAPFIYKFAWFLCAPPSSGTCCATSFAEDSHA